MKKNLIFSLLVMTFLMVGIVSALTVTNPSVNPTNPTTENTVTICADVSDISGDVTVSLTCESLEHDAKTNNMEDTSEGYCAGFSFTDLEDDEEMICEIEATDEVETVNINVDAFTYDGLPPIADAGDDQTVDVDEIVSFDGSGSLDTVTATEDLIYSWDFDEDGIEDSNEQNPTYTYDVADTYTVTLTVEDESGQISVEDTVIITVTEDSVPTAEFSWTPENPNEGEEVQFTDESESHDEIVNWLWDFDNDGTIDSTERNPTHIYLDDGTYTVILTVEDSDESTNTISYDITVNDLNPTAYLSGDTNLDEGEEGTWDASDSTSSPDEIESYEWDWDYEEGNFVVSGDEGVVQTHIYNEDGKYTVAVRITDDDGDISIATLEVTVNNFVPVITNLPTSEAIVIGNPFVFNVEVDDESPSDTLEYSLTNSPDGMTINPTTGEINWIPNEIGTYEIIVSITDGTDSDEEILTVSVYNYQIKLSEGWNLISIPLVPEGDNTNINNVFGLDISSNAEVIWSYTYDETLEKNVWKYNLPTEGGWDLNSLRVQNIIPGYGYYIKMNYEAVDYLNGKENYGMIDTNPGTLPQIHLTNGWNLIGHYGLESKQNYCALYSLIDTTVGHPRWSAVYGYNSESKEFIPIGESDLFNAGEGYWIEMDLADGYNPSTMC